MTFSEMYGGTAGRPADEGVERRVARGRIGEYPCRPSRGLKAEGGEYPRSSDYSLLSGVCLPTELDCLSPMSLNAIHLQDISVDEAEVRSKYEAGALAKVRPPISI